MGGYTIGQVSRILQMPQQTLRFLEGEGLVAPSRDASNNYRHYSLTDVNHLIDYRWYRDAGYSLQESIDAVLSEDLFQYAQKMREIGERAAVEARRQALVARRLESYTEQLSMDYLASHIGAYDVEESPEMQWCINAVEDEAGLTYKSAEQLKDWFSIVLEHYCFISHIVCVYAESIMDNRMNYGVTWGYGIALSWARELGIELSDDATHIPAAHSVHTVMRITEGESLVEAVRLKIKPHLQSEGLTLAGDVWGVEIATVRESGADVTYVDLWAPIE